MDKRREPIGKSRQSSPGIGVWEEGVAGYRAALYACALSLCMRGIAQAPPICRRPYITGGGENRQTGETWPEIWCHLYGNTSESRHLDTSMINVSDKTEPAGTLRAADDLAATTSFDILTRFLLHHGCQSPSRLYLSFITSVPKLEAPRMNAAVIIFDIDNRVY